MLLFPAQHDASSIRKRVAEIEEAKSPEVRQRSIDKLVKNAKGESFQLRTGMRPRG
jgi:hypothetical protein